MECDVIQQQLIELHGEAEALKVKLWNLIVALDRIRVRNECNLKKYTPDVDAETQVLAKGVV